MQTRIIAIADGRVSTAVFYDAQNWIVPETAIGPMSLGELISTNPDSLFSRDFLGTYGYPEEQAEVSIALSTPVPDRPAATPASPNLPTATPDPLGPGMLPLPLQTASPGTAGEGPMDVYPTPPSQSTDSSPGLAKPSCSQQSQTDCGLVWPRIRIVTGCEEGNCTGQDALVDRAKPLSFLVQPRTLLGSCLPCFDFSNHR